MTEIANAGVRHQRKEPQSLRQAEEIGLIGSRVWTQPEIIVLLREYKKRETLYDMKNVNYRNKFARQQALDDIADILCKIRPRTTGMDVKLKFNILRTQYHAELSKEKKYAESGKPHVTTLWFMDHIKFVRGHNRQEIYGHREQRDPDHRNSEELPEVRCQDQASLSGNNFAGADEKYEDYEIAGTESNEDPLSNATKQSVSPMIKTEKFIDDTESEFTSDTPEAKEGEEGGPSSPVISRATSTLLNREASARRPENTEVRYSEEDLFGQIVAKKLKKITDPKKRADTEFKIFSLLHSALVDELDS